jgi:hypothetical protein
VIVTDAIQVRVLGTAELLAKIDRLKDFHQSPRLLALFSDAGEAYRILVHRDAPKASRMLVQSFNYQVTGFGTPQIQLRLGFDQRASRYARYVEMGTSASVRTPRLRSFMFWQTMGPRGKTVQNTVFGLKGQKGYTSHFARRVRHPGTPAANGGTGFFLKHLDTVRDAMVKALKRTLDEEIQSAGGRP